MPNLNKLEVNRQAIQSLIVDGGNVKLIMKSGRVLIWPHSRKRCLTVAPGGEVINDFQVALEEMTSLEFDGAAISGYVTCPACSGMHKSTMKCECKNKD